MKVKSATPFVGSILRGVHVCKIGQISGQDHKVDVELFETLKEARSADVEKAGSVTDAKGPTLSIELKTLDT